MAIDPRNFLLNSDYPMDKIAGSITGSILVPGGSTGTPVVVSHSLGVAPLCILKWSTTSDFSISYDETGLITGISGYYSDMDSTSSQIYIAFLNNNASDATLYYRVYYFIPYDADIDIPATASNYDTFVLNTDYNYCKVLLEGRTSSNSETITHNLGYYPQVEVWRYAISGGPVGRYFHIVYGVLDSATVEYAMVSPTTLTLYSPSTADRFYYKVYADEN